jgi:hypothetical protein
MAISNTEKKVNSRGKGWCGWVYGALCLPWLSNTEKKVNSRGKGSGELGWMGPCAYPGSKSYPDHHYDLEQGKHKAPYTTTPHPLPLLLHRPFFFSKRYLARCYANPHGFTLKDRDVIGFIWLPVVCV